MLELAAISPQRLLYRDRQLDIVVSWHLSTANWEFATQMEQTPRLLNSRYMVTSLHGWDATTLVYDYCKST